MDLTPCFDTLFQKLCKEHFEELKRAIKSLKPVP